MSAQERDVDGADFQALLDFLAQTPTKLRQLTDGLSHADLRASDSDGQFSAVENLCHLRDLEVQGYMPRIKRILDEANPALADFDGARVAALSDYNRQDKDDALEAFATARRTNVEALRNLTEAQLDRLGTLEGVGQISLKRLAEMMREHDEGHLEDLRVRRQRLKDRI